MKTLLPFLSLLTLLAVSGCRSEQTQEIAPIGTVQAPVNPTNPTQTFDASGQTLLAQGPFMSNVHPTSGTVSLYEKAGKRTLVFTNFKTDGGPDLRIYLAETTGVRNFIEVSKLNATGNFFVELPAAADPTRQRFVLIWCKAFSVLFGNAELK
ncbi:DM13 domain-containing protein [Spirosoma montaniterrae]|uniref:DM13 domain-containing protein n=1 Tax=Spirosoma montaniterrae TaxID=1178516 RepID=A0A1P9WSE9_9BACT|nr:DM13 domain-containing protein [Spirosoma montaniterrae]AQG78292.1 hypothetical protein AWR27_02415 [Spirosoma montaniterrae]